MHRVDSKAAIWLVGGALTVFVMAMSFMLWAYATGGSGSDAAPPKPDAALQKMLASATSDTTPPLTDSDRIALAQRKITMRLARQAFAKRIEDGFLELGLDIKVTCTGDDRTTLHLDYVLASRPFAYQLDKSGFLDRAQQIGFKRVELAGYSFATAWKL